MKRIEKACGHYIGLFLSQLRFWCASSPAYGMGSLLGRIIGEFRPGKSGPTDEMILGTHDPNMIRFDLGGPSGSETKAPWNSFT